MEVTCKSLSKAFSANEEHVRPKARPEVLSCESGKLPLECGVLEVKPGQSLARPESSDFSPTSYLCMPHATLASWLPPFPGQVFNSQCAQRAFISHHIRGEWHVQQRNSFHEKRKLRRTSPAGSRV